MFHVSEPLCFGSFLKVWQLVIFTTGLFFQPVVSCVTQDHWVLPKPFTIPIGTF